MTLSLISLYKDCVVKSNIISRRKAYFKREKGSKKGLFWRTGCERMVYVGYTYLGLISRKD